MKPKIKFFLVVIVGLIALTGLGFFIAKAANASRPGDFLFAADKALENLERSLIPGRKKDIYFEQDILKERVGELKEIEEDVSRTEDQQELDLLERNLEKAKKEVNEQEDRVDEVEAEQ